MGPVPFLVDFVDWPLPQPDQEGLLFAEKRYYRRKLKLDLMEVQWERQAKLDDNDIPYRREFEKEEGHTMDQELEG
jgi:hypothetical protein